MHFNNPIQLRLPDPLLSCCFSNPESDVLHLTFRLILLCILVLHQSPARGNALPVQLDHYSTVSHVLVKIGSARNTKACLTQHALCFFPAVLSYPAVGGQPWRSSSLTSADMPPSPKVFLRSAVGFSRLIGAALSLPATHGPSSRVQRICNNSSRSRTRSLIPPVSLQYPKRPMTCLLLTW